MRDRSHSGPALRPGRRPAGQPGEVLAPRAAGGELNWLISQSWNGTWNALTAAGRTRHLFQVLTGILPEVGAWQPNGQWAWNLDLWAEAPVLVSRDPMTAVYRIRPEAAWSDGTPITVDDFQFQWRARSGRADHCADCSPPGTSGFDRMASVEGADHGRTVTVTYRQGANDPLWFGRWDRMYPAHVPARAGIDWRTPNGMREAMSYFAQHVPDWSGGPYQIDSATVDERVVMVPNPRWYGRTRPTLDRITKLALPDPEAWLPALQRGEINGGWPTFWSAEFRRQLDHLPHLRTTVGSAWHWEHLDVNLRSLPDLALRKAVFTAIDTAHARDAIWGNIAPPFRTNYIFPTGTRYHQDSLTGTGFGSGDSEAARSILAHAGYTGFEPGRFLAGPDRQPLRPLRLVFQTEAELRTRFAALTAGYLAQLGISVEPRALPRPEFESALAAGDFDLAVFAWGASPFFTGPAHQYFHSTSSSNYGGMDNPQVDHLAEQIRNQVCIDDSAILINQLIPLVVAEAMVLPLWTYPELVFVSNRYVNIEPNFYALNNPLYNLAAWGLAPDH